MKNKLLYCLILILTGCNNSDSFNAKNSSQKPTTISNESKNKFDPLKLDKDLHKSFKTIDENIATERDRIEAYKREAEIKIKQDLQRINDNQKKAWGH